VARTYAGILGPLALIASLAHGLIHAAEIDVMLFWAWGSLLVFAPIGYVVGALAGRTVEESVRSAIEVELAREESAEPVGAGSG